eukprot:2006200-Rhodomonas_salina.6
MESYKALVHRIYQNKLASKLHTDESLILRFVQKLKPKVQVHLTDKTFTSLEEAYSADIKQDKLIFAADTASKSPSNRNAGARGGSSTPSSAGSRAGSQPPPAHLMALLNLFSMGTDWDAVQKAAAKQLSAMPPPSGPSSSPSQAQTLGAVEKDHSVPPGAPIHKMTPEIQRWCEKHNACFRCREKHATHRSAQCPRFENIPHRPDYIASRAALAAARQENDQSSG